MEIMYQLSIFTWLVCNLLTVAVHGFFSNKLDPVLNLSHSGIHTLAGTLKSKANHANLGESKLKHLWMTSIIDFKLQFCRYHAYSVQIFISPSVFRDNQGTSRVSLARILAVVGVSSTNVKSTKIHKQQIIIFDIEMSYIIYRCDTFQSCQDNNVCTLHQTSQSPLPPGVLMLDCHQLLCPPTQSPWPPGLCTGTGWRRGGKWGKQWRKRSGALSKTVWKNQNQHSHCCILGGF